MDRILLSTRAARDLRRLGPGPELDRLEAGLERLNRGEPNLDIKPVQSHHSPKDNLPGHHISA